MGQPVPGQFEVDGVRYSAYLIPFKTLPDHHINIEQLYDRRIRIKTNWMDALLCHQTPSEFVREEIENDRCPEISEYDLTLFDQSAILSTRRRLNTADRLIWTLVPLTWNLEKERRIDSNCMGKNIKWCQNKKFRSFCRKRICLSNFFETRQKMCSNRRSNNVFPNNY